MNDPLPMLQKPAKPAVATKPSRVRRAPKEKPVVATQARAILTRETILQAAVKVFSKSGFDGGRIETISKLARTHDRLIYYYFGSKENLFVEVLKTVYKRMNDAESTLAIDLEQPTDALLQILDFMWRYYLEHPEFITLLNTENLHQGKHLRRAQSMRELVSPAITMLDRVLAAGAEQGLFREVSARDVYLAIASLGYFYLSNRYTLSAFLDEPLMEQDALMHWRSFIADAVLRIVAAPPIGTVKPARPRRPRSA